MTFPQVSRQISLVRIGLFAVVASIELIFRVNVNVFHVLGPTDEPFLTLLALVDVLLSVPTTMKFQVRLLIGGIIAEIASELLLTGVNQLVARYVHRTTKGFAALVAIEGSFDAMKILQVLD